MATAALENSRGHRLRSAVMDRLRDARHLPESMLHTRRRATARAQVRGVKARSVLFVCSGNICRSPFAALLFERLLQSHRAGVMSVRSAGFIGAGRASPAHALIAARKYGVKLSSHRSAPLTDESLRTPDLVVVMSEDQRRAVRSRVRPDSIVVVLGDLDPLPCTRRTILDPWDGPAADFEASYARIDRCVRELLRAMALTSEVGDYIREA